MPDSTAPQGNSRYEKGHLISLLSEVEKDDLGDLIEQVFVIHGKHTSAKSRSILTAELAHANIPFKHLVAGLQDLKDEENIPGLELWRIKAACRKHQHADFKASACPDCNAEGTVTMIYATGDRRGRETNLACSCPNGERWARGSNNFKALLRWNGLPEQGHGPYLLVAWPRNQERPSVRPA